jgi:hypothetical protein
MYRRIGILSFSSPGHFYPLTALGRRLQSRGHDVVYFQVADLESPIRAAGLRFRQIGQHDFPLGSLRARDEEGGKLEGLAALRCGIRGIVMKSQMIFRDAPAAIRDERVNALIVDQIEPAGGTVAEHLGLPFVNVAAALPVNLDVSVPPVTFPWSHRIGPWAPTLGPTPELDRQQCQRADLLGSSGDNQRASPSLEASPYQGFQRFVVGADSSRATARHSGVAGSEFATRLPSHRPLDRCGRASTGGLPLGAD